jgi:hypothetical protein
VHAFLPCTEAAKAEAEILSAWQPRQVAGSMAIPCSAADGMGNNKSNNSMGNMQRLFAKIVILGLLFRQQLTVAAESDKYSSYNQYCDNESKLDDTECLHCSLLVKWYLF